MSGRLLQIRLFFPRVAATLLIAGCASENPAPVVDRSATYVQPDTQPSSTRAPVESASGTYQVVRGDTLYAIAFKHGLDYREVAAWNNIAPPYRIYVGQQLKLAAGSAAVAHETAPLQPRTAPAAPPSTPSSAPTVAAAPPSAATTTTTPAKSASGMFEDVPAGEAASDSPKSASAPPAPSPKPPEVAPVPTVTPAKPIVAEAPPAPATRASDTSAANVGGVLWRWPGRGSLVGNFVAGDQTRQGIDIAGTSGDPVLAAADGEVVYSGNGLLGYGELIIVKHNATFLSAYGHNRKRLVQEGERIKAGQQIAEMGSSASARDELHFEIRKNGKPVNPLDYLPAR